MAQRTSSSVVSPSALANTKRAYTGLKEPPQIRKSTERVSAVITGFTVDWPMGRLTATIGRPNKIPATKPKTGLGSTLRDFMMAKKRPPTTTPITKTSKTAAICSPVLDAAATLMPTNSMESIIKSMPKVTTGPGSTRVIQSKRA